MRNKIFSLLAILMGIFLLSSCLKDNKEENENITTDDTAITAFSLGKLKLVRDSVNKAGRDSTYIIDYDASSYKFYIDQAQGLIYNPDSLPYGTNVAKVLAKVTTKKGGRVSIQSVKDLSLKYFNENDSTDFSTPRILIVTALNGTSYRNYRVTVNVHKQRGNVFSWSALPKNQELELLTDNKAIAFAGKVFVFGRKDNRTYGYFTNEEDGMEWTKLPGSFSADAYRGVIAHEKHLYIIDNGEVKRSADGLSWTVVSNTSLTQLVAEDTKNIYGISDSGALYASNDNGATWSAEETDDDMAMFPTADFSYITRTLSTNRSIEYTTLVGTTPMFSQAVAWTKLVDKKDAVHYKWSFIDNNNAHSYTLPKYIDLHVLDFNGKLLAMGVENKVFAPMLVSEDGGITWKKFNQFSLPANLMAAGAFTAVRDSHKFIWIICGGTIWRGRLNSDGWTKDQTAFTE